VSDESLLFSGPLGPLGVEDVLQFVAQVGLAVRVSFETGDRAHGWPRAVDLTVIDGRLVGLGPRGTGLRLGDLVVGRRMASRRRVEEIAAALRDEPSLPARPPHDRRLGAGLVAAGLCDEAALEDLLWERHARVVWGLLTWDRGTFIVTGAAASEALPAPVPVDPPLPLAGMMLDGLQRAEAALAGDVDIAAMLAADSDPGSS
jgi:hypothetical protein